MFALEKSNYKLNKIDFNVDVPFNNKIKLPFENKSFFYIIVGKPGSGKTSLLVNMLTNSKIYKKVFTKILLCMPKNSRLSLKDDIFEDLPEDQIFDTVNESILTKIKANKEEFEQDKLERIQSGRKPIQHHQLLILDDVTAHLKNKDNVNLLIELATNRRHYNLSIVLLVQFLRSIPRPIRFFTTSCIFFKASNNLDTEILREEYINLPKHTFENLLNFVFDTDAHDYLIINKDSNTYYKKMQKIIFTDNI
jgi:GTPase SAR1 family protein